MFRGELRGRGHYWGRDEWGRDEWGMDEFRGRVTFNLRGRGCT